MKQLTEQQVKDLIHIINCSLIDLRKGDLEFPETIEHMENNLNAALKILS